MSEADYSLWQIPFLCNFNWSSSSLNQLKMKDGQWMCNDTGREASLFCGVSSNTLVSARSPVWDISKSILPSTERDLPAWKCKDKTSLRHWSITCSFLFLSNHLWVYFLNAERIKCIQINTNFFKSVKDLKTQKQSLGCHCATWIQLWNVLGSTGLCQSCFGGQKGSGHHCLMNILSLLSQVAGLDKMLTISTTSKREQKVFVLSTQTVGTFCTCTASQGVRITELKN